VLNTLAMSLAVSVCSKELWQNLTMQNIKWHTLLIAFMCFSMYINTGEIMHVVH